VLVGVDDVDWARLDGPYRELSDDIAGMLRGLVTGDADQYAECYEALSELSRYDSCVTDAGTALVPFLAEVCVLTPHSRSEMLWWLGELTDDVVSVGVDGARAALEPQVGLIVPLLSDRDPEVRAAAAYVLRQAGGAYPAEVLWRQWAGEEVPAVRTALLAALIERDPAGAADIARKTLMAGNANDRFIAALGLYWRGLEPKTDMIRAMRQAVDDGADPLSGWSIDPEDILDEIEEFGDKRAN
jgi:hypothetical protein